MDLDSSVDITLIGNRFGQTIEGSAGDDYLIGRGGRDVLLGRAGNDVFVFNTTLGYGNVDRVRGFSTSDDMIRLDDAVFTTLTNGPLASSAFRANVSGTAADGSDRILYETDSGRLFYDADGQGGLGRVHFATLANKPLALSASDLEII